MPDRPLKYLGRYKPLQFSGCGGQGQKSIRINSYISGDVMSNNLFRKKAYVDVKAFIFKTDRYAGGAAGANEHYYFSDTEFLMGGDMSPIPFHYCPWDDVRQAFQGKGTPTRMTRAVKLLDYYLRHAQIDPGELGWGKVVTSLQEYVDYYIGMDCNGFVGAFLEENCPGSGISGNIDIDSYGKYYGTNTSGSGFTRIEKPEDIRTGDILIRRRIGDESRHVALVEQLNSATSKEAKLLLAESTGGSGLGSNTITFKKLPKTTAEGRNWKRGEKEYDAVIRSK